MDTENDSTTVDVSDLFVAPDGTGQPTLWREEPDHPSMPTPLVADWVLRADPRLWDRLVAGIEVRS